MERRIARHLAGAELWSRAGADGAGDAPGAVFVAGWEDGDHFCATVCSTDPGLAFCRRCPTDVVGHVLATGRAAHGHCQAGGRLLAFPAPRGSRRTVGVLRVRPPTARSAAQVAEATKVAPDALRRAARGAVAADGRAALAAARTLRDPASLEEWQVRQREKGADRRRTATAALAQMVASSEEIYELLQASEQQRRRIERQERRLDRLARETLKASDLERARIAHQIHDTAAQSLVSAYRFLEAARASGPHRADGPGAAAAVTASPGSTADASPDGYLMAASERLLAAIGEVRSVLARLLPPGLEELGLAHAIRSRLDALASEAGIETELQGDLPRLDGWVEQAMYGMAVEAMTNAVRHADAGHLRVSLSEARGRAIILVSDDGHGFDSDRLERRPAGHGLGLLGMTRQARWLGGTASVRSRRGSGTTVRLSIPLTRHRSDRTPTGSGRLS